MLALCFIRGHFNYAQNYASIIHQTLYNRPELSKHRKRDHLNLNAVELRHLSSELFTVLLNPFFKRSRWCMFQVHVELLAKSLASYVDYLGERNKQMKSSHSALAPSRQLEDNLAISFLTVLASRPSVLDSLNQTLAVSSQSVILLLDIPHIGFLVQRKGVCLSQGCSVSAFVPPSTHV